MKLGKGLLLVLALTLGVGSAFAQSIDVVGDPLGNTCSGPMTPGTTPIIWIIARPGPAVAAGITGAEFYVQGRPAGWLTIATPNAAANVALGNPFELSGGNYRANIGFPACQPFAGGVLTLYTVTVIPLSVVGETYLNVVVANPPTNVTFTTPIVTACDAPEYTAYAARGGSYIINGRPCTVGVESTTWSQVKALY